MSDGIKILPNTLNGNEPELANCKYIEVHTNKNAGSPIKAGFIVNYTTETKDSFDYLLAQYNSHIDKKYLDKLPETDSKYKGDSDAYNGAHGIYTALDEIGKALLRVFVRGTFYQILLYDAPNGTLQFTIQNEGSLRDNDYILSIYLNSDQGIDDMSISVHEDKEVVSDPHAQQIIPIGNLNRDHIGHEIYTRAEFMFEGLVNGQTYMDSYRRLICLGNYSEPKSPLNVTFDGTQVQLQGTTFNVSTGNELFSALKLISESSSGDYIINQTSDIVLNDLSTVKSKSDITIPNPWTMSTGTGNCNLTYNGNNHKIYGFLSNTSSLFPRLNKLEINDLLFDTGYYLVTADNTNSGAVIDVVDNLILNNVENHISIICYSDTFTARVWYASFASDVHQGLIQDSVNYGSCINFDKSRQFNSYASAFIGQLSRNGTLKFLRCINYGSVISNPDYPILHASAFLGSSVANSTIDFESCANYGTLNAEYISAFCQDCYGNASAKRLVNNGPLISSGDSWYTHPIFGRVSGSLTYDNKIYNNTSLTKSYSRTIDSESIPLEDLKICSDSMLLKVPTDTSSLTYIMNDSETDKCWKVLEIGTYPITYKTSKIHSI